MQEPLISPEYASTINLWREPTVLQFHKVKNVDLRFTISLAFGMRETTSLGGHQRRRAEWEQAKRMRLIRGKAEYGAYLRTLPGRYNGIPRVGLAPGCPGWGEPWPCQVINGDDGHLGRDPMEMVRNLIAGARKPPSRLRRLWNWIRRRSCR